MGFNSGFKGLILPTVDRKWHNQIVLR